MAIRKRRRVTANANITVNGEHHIRVLSKRIEMHMPYVLNEHEAFELLIRPEDRQAVLDAGNLYTYVSMPHLDWTVTKHGDVKLHNGTFRLHFEKLRSWLPPHYLLGDVQIHKLSQAFLDRLEAYTSQSVPLFVQTNIAVAAYTQLMALCNNDIARARALWPTLDVLAEVAGERIDRPTPRMLPSLSVELREMLAEASTLINSALLLPTPEPAENNTVYITTESVIK